MHNEYSIRLFLPEEADQYKAIRLEALALEPGNFGNSHAMEAAMTDEEWLERLTSPNMGRFGLYHNGELIGLTAIIQDKDKPEEAYMTQSYIRKEHRGKGLSKMLYEARLNWAKEHGLKYLVIGHRESNISSKAANQKFGFRFTHKELRDWPDGAKEDMYYYTLEL